MVIHEAVRKCILFLSVMSYNVRWDVPLLIRGNYFRVVLTFSLNSSCGMTDVSNIGSMAKSSWIRSKTCSDRSLTDDLPITKT